MIVLSHNMLGLLSAFRGKVPPRARRRRGVIVVLFGILLTAFLAAAAFSIDVAYMHLVNSELRAATDAAAKSAVSNLSRTHDVDQARQAAIETASANLVAGRPLVLQPTDIVFGKGQLQSDGTIAFLPGQTPLCAAKVDVSLASSSPNAPVGLFFGNLLGTGIYETELFAVAAHLDRDIALVVDRSGSMDGTKMEELKTAVTVFLNTLGQTPYPESVGLASYNGTATLDEQLTTNLAQIQATMDSLVAGGSTNIGDGIKQGNDILTAGSSSKYVEKTMILMTDGLHNTGAPPLPQARAAAGQHIVIHTITFGSGADQALMQNVAQASGGNHYHAPTGQDLIEIYEEIALTLTTILTE
jgi:uncharacterized protein YegL